MAQVPAQGSAPSRLGLLPLRKESGESGHETQLVHTLGRASPLILDFQPHHAGKVESPPSAIRGSPPQHQGQQTSRGQEG